MVSNIAIGLGLAFVLSLVDYLSEGALRNTRTLKEGFVSLAAGISTTYIFLHLFPLVYSGVQSISRWIFVFVLSEIEYPPPLNLLKYPWATGYPTNPFPPHLNENGEFVSSASFTSLDKTTFLHSPCSVR